MTKKLLKLSDFIDRGADGTIDTFKVRLFIDENENSLTYNEISKV